MPIDLPDLRDVALHDESFDLDQVMTVAVLKTVITHESRIAGVPWEYELAVDDPAPDGGWFEVQRDDGNQVLVALSGKDVSDARYYADAFATVVWDNRTETREAVAVLYGEPDPDAGAGVAHAPGDYYLQIDGGGAYVGLWVGGPFGDKSWTEVTAQTVGSDDVGSSQAFSGTTPGWAWAVALTLAAYFEGASAPTVAASVAASGGPLFDAPIAFSFVADLAEWYNVPLESDASNLDTGTYTQTQTAEGASETWGADLYTPEAGEFLRRVWAYLTQEFDGSDAGNATLLVDPPEEYPWGGLQTFDLTDNTNIPDESGYVVFEGSNPLIYPPEGSDTSAPVKLRAALPLRFGLPSAARDATQGRVEVYIEIIRPL